MCKLVSPEDRCTLPRVMHKVDFLLEVRDWKKGRKEQVDEKDEDEDSEDDCVVAHEEAVGRARAKSLSLPTKRNQAACICDGSSRTGPTLQCPCTCTRMSVSGNLQVLKQRASFVKCTMCTAVVGLNRSELDRCTMAGICDCPLFTGWPPEGTHCPPACPQLLSSMLHCLAGILSLFSPLQHLHSLFVR